MACHNPGRVGSRPDSALTDNPDLEGTVAWDGALLGFSRSLPVAGGARLEIDLAIALDPFARHDLRFTDLHFINQSGNSDQLFPERNLNYEVSLDAEGNLFQDAGGLIQGSFFGSGHEAMGGTIKRTDLVGAFGGVR